MSIRSFVNQIWEKIKSFFRNFPPELKNAIHLGVLITENLKVLIDSPVTDIITAIIPGDTDDKLKTTLRALLPKILINLKLATNCDNETDALQIANSAINALQTMDLNVRNAFLHNLSIMVAQVAADGKLNWSDGVFLIEWYYKNEFKPAENF